MIDTLTTNQIQVLIAGVGLIGIVLGALLGSIGFLARRWITGSARHEKVGYLSSVAELATRLRALDMTVADIDDLERLLASPRLGSSEKALEVVTGPAAVPLPAPFATTFALHARASAAADVANAELEQALVDLRLLSDDLDVETIDTVQASWRAYRTEIMQAAAAEFAGGSQAPLAAALAGISETERRLSDVRGSVRARMMP